MKSLLRITGMILAVALVFTACKKSVPKQVGYVPKDASFVVGINPKELNDKLAKSNISLDSLVKASLSGATASDDIKKWEDLKNSGIDFTTEAYVFVQIKGAIMTGNSTVIGAVAALKDAAKFEAYLKKQEPGASIQKGNNFSYASLKHNDVIGWNDNVLILTSVVSSPRRFDDTTTTDNSAVAQQQLTALFAQKEEESVASIPEFRDLAATKADAILWTNSSNTLNSVPFLSMTKASDLLKDSYSAGTVDFQDGKTVVTYKSYTNKALGDILKKYAGPTVDLSMIEQYPSNSVDGFMAFSFNPQLIVEILHFIGLDVTANSYLTNNLGLTIDDITKAFKGDFAFVVSDLGEKEITSPFDPTLKYKRTTAKYVFNAKVGDKAAYNKIASLCASKGLLVASGNGYSLRGGDFVTGTVDEKNLLVASDSALLLQYKAGSGKASIAGDIKDKVKGKAFGMYVDITKILGSFSPSDSSDAALHKLALQSFKDVVISGDNFDGKNVKGLLEFRTGNDKENSLATIVKFASAAAAASKEKTARLKTQWGTDSTATVAPIDTATVH